VSAEHPYTEAYDDDGVVYVSGALSVDPDGKVVGGRRPALEAALEKLRDRLGTVGLGLADVVKTTYFVTDVTLRDEANEQYADAFPEPRPARSFVEVARLPYGASVEIEAIARRRDHNRA
jgi:2-iminobutanoate/2-iminopropanoate deaminase